MSGSASLKEYLKKYQSGGGGNDGKKKRKKKKEDLKTKPSTAAGVVIVDEDPTWHKPVNVDDEEDEKNSSDDGAVVVEEDVEVKRLRRLQMLQLKKPYYSVSEDGSGWVSVSDAKDKVGDACGSFGVSGSGTQDVSPPRQRGGRRHFDTPSPEHDRMGEVSSPTRRREERDLSPPQKNQRDSLDLERTRRPPVGVDMSPPRRKRNDSSGDDLSPARWVRKSSGRHDSPELDVFRGSPRETDLLPPERNRKGSMEDHSPVRWGRHDSPDLGTNRGSSPEADLSPPRRNRKGSSDDLSPARRGQRSPTRFSVETHRLEPDISPPRKSRRISNDDISPPRRKGMGQQHSPVPSNAQRSSSSGIPPLPINKTQLSTTEEHRKGGLFTRGEIKDVIDKKKAEDVSRLAALDHTKSGVASEPVYRVKGKRVTKEEKMKLEKGEEKQKEVKLEWGKGIAQKREAEERKKELELEKERPFARTRDDPELDKILKERLRWGDPMAHLVKKKHSDIHLEDFGVDEKMKESGFIIPQAIPSHSWIKRGIDPPPNRYSIKPGRHWDGVDRSTGYEKELFKRQNDTRANQTEAYLWSVSDM